ncbi:MAG: ParA family protein [Deinococcota bacterium]
MSRIIALANQKGGVAKTTTTINLGAALAELGQKVLLVDADPQANLTVGMGLDPSSIETTLAQVLAQDEGSIADAIYETDLDNLQVVPSDIGLADVEFAMVNRFSRETLLRSAIRDDVRANYDFILIDSPPNLGMLTINVLCATQEVIVPVATHFFALQGLTTLLNRLRFIQGKLNPELRVLGLLATRHDPRTLLGKQVIDQLPGYHLPVFQTVITEAVRLAEAPSVGKTILEYHPSGSSAGQYRALAEELLA